MKNDKARLKKIEDINISFFLERLCGISHSNNKNMTHKDMDELFPKIKRTSYAHILENPALVHTGSVVLVRDAKYSLAPYVVPSNPLTVSKTKEELAESFVSVFETITELSTDALLIIENNRLLDKHMTEHRFVCEGENQKQLLSSLIDAANEKRGLICSDVGNVYSYRDLIINNQKTTCLNLEAQALIITSLTDATALLIEETKEITFIADGYKHSGLDIKEITRMIKTKSLKEEVKEETTEKAYSLSAMPIYELEKLMSHYKKSGEMSYYRAIRKAISNKTESTKNYKKAKQKIIDRGSEYEEY